MYQTNVQVTKVENGYIVVANAPVESVLADPWDSVSKTYVFETLTEVHQFQNSLFIQGIWPDYA